MPSIYEDYARLADQARLANLKRKEQVESIFDEIIQRYGPGGSFGAGYEAQLGRQKVQDVGTAEQRDISSGLFGLRDRGGEWEATTGAESRLRLEDLRMERLSQAQTGKAGFLERIEEPYPDQGALGQYAQAQATVKAAEIAAADAQRARNQATIAGSSAEFREFMKDLAGGSYGSRTGGGRGASPAQSIPQTTEQKAESERKNQAAADLRQTMSQQKPLNYADFISSEQTGTAPKEGTFTGGGGGQFGGTGATGGWEEPTAGGQPNPAAISKFAGMDKWNVGYQTFTNYQEALEASKKYSK